MPNAVCRCTRVTCGVRKGELLLSSLACFLFREHITKKVGLKRCRVELWVGSKQETAKSHHNGCMFYLCRRVLFCCLALRRSHFNWSVLQLYSNIYPGCCSLSVR